MKIFSSFPVCVVACAIFCSEIPAVSAPKTRQTVVDDAVPAEKVEERLKQLDDALMKQKRAFASVVNSEVAAKRINSNTAQLLPILAQAEPFDSNEFNRNVPQDNVAIVAASKELGAALKLHQLRLKAVADGLSVELSRRVGDAVLGKLKPTEIKTLTQTIQRVQGVMQQRKIVMEQAGFSWQKLTQTLELAQQLAEAESNKSAAMLSTAVASLKRGTMSGNIFTQEEIKERIARLVEPMRKEMEDNRNALEAKIEARKPSQEIAGAIKAYLESAGRFNAVSDEQASYRLRSEQDAEREFYTRISEVMKALENGEYEQAKQSLKGAAIRRPDASGSNNRERLVDGIQKELTGKISKLSEQFTAEIHTRITAVKGPADLDALIREVEKMSRQLGQSDIGDGIKRDISSLAWFLGVLKNSWSVNSVRRSAQQEQTLAAIQQEPPAAFAKDLAVLRAVRDRAMHTVYADALKAPELTTEIYADKDPEAAYEAFCDDLARRGEWKRLFDILQLRSPAAEQRLGHKDKEDETLAAIRSYLAGKNSELAEQWTDAVLAYKVVLRSTARRAPVQAAAECIKAIAKAHPEAIKEANSKEIPAANVSPAQ